MAVLGGSLALPAGMAVKAAVDKPDRPPGWAIFDDPSWPKNETLPAKDCRAGAPIDHQQMRKVAGALVAMVDTRCEPPFDQQYAGVYTGPAYETKLVGRVYNGQFVAVTCEGEGVPVGDARGGDPNTDWFGVQYKDASGNVHNGRLNGANMGQLDPQSAQGELPPCA
jgi:hypothetical protein